LIRRRVFLLDRFADYLADAWVEAFMKEYREERLLQARGVALDALARMLLADVHDLERQFGKQRVDADEELNDACNAIHLPAPPSGEELAGAAVMHGAFYAYLRAKHSL
jgi:hypothetical protein